ncbi:hypothetical protein BH18ACI5_BH18ACI5_00880 [soil metagenome]
MPVWAVATAVYSIYVVILAALLPRLRWRARAAAAMTSLPALALAFLAPHAHAFVFHSLVYPLGSLLLGYRATGFLWRTHNLRFEAMLAAADATLRVRELSHRAPRVVAEFLEFAYAAVYPLIPLAFWLHLRFAPVPNPDCFWTVVLVTDYVCFSLLPWIQTRPPRAIEERAPWHASLRRLNLDILDTASIQMNTVPSGHAAEALVCALLLVGAPPAILALMVLMTAAISAGALFGRYHYSIDILSGWIVAVAVFIAIQGSCAVRG